MSAKAIEDKPYVPIYAPAWVVAFSLATFKELYVVKGLRLEDAASSENGLEAELRGTPSSNPALEAELRGTPSS